MGLFTRKRIDLQPGDPPQELELDIHKLGWFRRRQDITGARVRLTITPGAGSLDNTDFTLDETGIIRPVYTPPATAVDPARSRIEIRVSHPNYPSRTPFRIPISVGAVLQAPDVTVAAITINEGQDARITVEVRESAGGPGLDGANVAINLGFGALGPFTGTTSGASAIRAGQFIQVIPATEFAYSDGTGGTPDTRNPNTTPYQFDAVVTVTGRQAPANPYERYILVNARGAPPALTATPTPIPVVINETEDANFIVQVTPPRNGDCRIRIRSVDGSFPEIIGIATGGVAAAGGGGGTPASYAARVTGLPYRAANYQFTTEVIPDPPNYIGAAPTTGGITVNPRPAPIIIDTVPGGIITARQVDGNFNVQVRVTDSMGNGTLLNGLSARIRSLDGAFVTVNGVLGMGGAGVAATQTLNIVYPTTLTPARYQFQVEVLGLPPTLLAPVAPVTRNYDIRGDLRVRIVDDNITITEPQNADVEIQVDDSAGNGVDTEVEIRSAQFPGIAGINATGGRAGVLATASRAIGGLTNVGSPYDYTVRVRNCANPFYDFPAAPTIGRITVDPAIIENLTMTVAPNLRIIDEGDNAQLLISIVTAGGVGIPGLEVEFISAGLFVPRQTTDATGQINLIIPGLAARATDYNITARVIGAIPAGYRRPAAVPFFVRVNSTNRELRAFPVVSPEIVPEGEELRVRIHVVELDPLGAPQPEGQDCEGVITCATIPGSPFRGRIYRRAGVPAEGEIVIPSVPFGAIGSHNYDVQVNAPPAGFIPAGPQPGIINVTRETLTLLVLSKDKTITEGDPIPQIISLVTNPALDGVNGVQITVNIDGNIQTPGRTMGGGPATPSTHPQNVDPALILPVGVHNYSVEITDPTVGYVAPAVEFGTITVNARPRDANIRFKLDPNRRIDVSESIAIDVFVEDATTGAGIEAEVRLNIPGIGYSRVETSIGGVTSFLKNGSSLSLGANPFTVTVISVPSGSHLIGAVANGIIEVGNELELGLALVNPSINPGDNAKLSLQLRNIINHALPVNINVPIIVKVGTLAGIPINLPANATGPIVTPANVLTGTNTLIPGVYPVSITLGVVPLGYNIILPPNIDLTVNTPVVENLNLRMVLVPSDINQGDTAKIEFRLENVADPTLPVNINLPVIVSVETLAGQNITVPANASGAGHIVENLTDTDRLMRRPAPYRVSVALGPVPAGYAVNVPADVGLIVNAPAAENLQLEMALLSAHITQGNDAYVALRLVNVTNPALPVAINTPIQITVEGLTDQIIIIPGNTSGPSKVIQRLTNTNTLIARPADYRVSSLVPMIPSYTIINAADVGLTVTSSRTLTLNINNDNFTEGSRTPDEGFIDFEILESGAIIGYNVRVRITSTDSELASAVSEYDVINGRFRLSVTGLRGRVAPYRYKVTILPITGYVGLPTDVEGQIKVDPFSPGLKIVALVSWAPKEVPEGDVAHLNLVVIDQVTGMPIPAADVDVVDPDGHTWGGRTNSEGKIPMQDTYTANGVGTKVFNIQVSYSGITIGPSAVNFQVIPRGSPNKGVGFEVIR